MTKLSLYLASLLLGANFSPSVTATAPATAITRQAVNLSEAEQRMMNLVNAERWNNNLSTLSINPTLVETARLHSREMAEKDYFDHISPASETETPMKRYLSQFGHRPTWAKLGENLYYCSMTDPNRGHRALMESPRHRENMLDPDYNEIGVGVYTSDDGRFWVTQLYLSQVK